MTDRFNTWFVWLLKWEGTEYEDVPGDRGGPTKFGIDKRTHPNVDIKNLTRCQAAQIYWDEYWNKVRAEELPLGVGEIIANIGVNTGKGNSGKWLQAALGVTIDGDIGPNTLKAAKAANPKDLCNKLLTRLENYYKSIGTGTNKKFLKGWLNRTNDLRTFVNTLVK